MATLLSRKGPRANLWLQGQIVLSATALVQLQLENRVCAQAAQHLTEIPMSPTRWDLQLWGNAIFSVGFFFFPVQSVWNNEGCVTAQQSEVLPSSILLLYRKMAVSYHTHPSCSYSEGGKAEERQQKTFFFDIDVCIEMLPWFCLVFNSASYYWM